MRPSRKRSVSNVNIPSENHNKAASGELRLPEAVREIRNSLGMTQAVFAEKFGLNRIQVIALEKGRANPTLETLEKIGRVFGFTVGFVLREKPPLPGEGNSNGEG